MDINAKITYNNWINIFTVVILHARTSYVQLYLCNFNIIFFEHNQYVIS